jgi:hypothetical protein
MQCHHSDSDYAEQNGTSPNQYREGLVHIRRALCRIWSAKATLRLGSGPWNGQHLSAVCGLASIRLVLP